MARQEAGREQHDLNQSALAELHSKDALHNSFLPIDTELYHLQVDSLEAELKDARREGTQLREERDELASLLTGQPHATLGGLASQHCYPACNLTRWHQVTHRQGESHGCGAQGLIATL